MFDFLKSKDSTKKHTIAQTFFPTKQSFENKLETIMDTYPPELRPTVQRMANEIYMGWEKGWSPYQIIDYIVENNIFPAASPEIIDEAVMQLGGHLIAPSLRISLSNPFPKTPSEPPIIKLEKQLDQQIKNPLSTNIFTIFELELFPYRSLQYPNNQQNETHETLNCIREFKYDKCLDSLMKKLKALSLSARYHFVDILEYSTFGRPYENPCDMNFYHTRQKQIDFDKTTQELLSSGLIEMNKVSNPEIILNSYYKDDLIKFMTNPERLPKKGWTKRKIIEFMLANYKSIIIELTDNRFFVDLSPDVKQVRDIALPYLKELSNC